MRHEVAAEHVAVRAAFHLMVKHAVDDLVRDLATMFERQVVPAADEAKSKLAVNIARGRG